MCIYIYMMVRKRKHLISFLKENTWHLSLTLEVIILGCKHAYWYDCLFIAKKRQQGFTFTREIISHPLHLKQFEMRILYLPTTEAPLSAKASAYSFPRPIEGEKDIWVKRFSILLIEQHTHISESVVELLHMPFHTLASYFDPCVLQIRRLTHVCC